MVTRESEETKLMAGCGEIGFGAVFSKVTSTDAAIDDQSPAFNENWVGDTTIKYA
jgi:hypothetical protein